METNEQVDSPVEETQQEEQTQEVSEQEQQEQVKALLSDETTEPEPEAEQEPEAEPETVVNSEPVVTDEMVEKFPSLKMFRGKKLEDLTPIYDKLVRKYQNEIRVRKELEGKLETTSLNELGEPPDPIENPDGFKKWLEKRDKLIKQQTLSEVQSQPQQVNYVDEVQKHLPEGINAQKVVDEWAKFNARRLFDAMGNLKPEMQKMYQEDPDLIIDEITSYYNLLSKAEKNDMQIQQEAKKETYKQTKEAFQNARKTKTESSQVHTVQRTNTLTPEDELLNKIYQNALSG